MPARAVNDNQTPKTKAESLMTIALRRLFALIGSADSRDFSALLLRSSPPARRRRAPHRQRRASPHAMRFRKQQVLRAAPLLVETPLSRVC
jgi:hypothetical protein